jgi:hypothetical protein
MAKSKLTAYITAKIRPANLVESRVDRRLVKHQTGKRRVMIALRQLQKPLGVLGIVISALPSALLTTSVAPKRLATTSRLSSISTMMISAGELNCAVKNAARLACGHITFENVKIGPAYRRLCHADDRVGLVFHDRLWPILQRLLEGAGIDKGFHGVGFPLAARVCADFRWWAH